VIGKDSLPLAYDAELPAVIYGVFRELGFGDFVIRVNHRRLLREILEGLGIAADRHADVLHEVDRLGKQDRAEVAARIAAITSADVAARLLDTLALPLDRLPASPGRDELARVVDGTRALGVPESAVVVDLSIARGLDYYTGTVYETFLVGHERLGSICSGGRYDNLAEHYTKSKLPGVGISIGATRLFSQLLEMKVIDEAAGAVAQVCVLRVEAGLGAAYAGMASELRAAGLNVEVYGGDDKLGKQLKYAVRGKVPLAVIYGARERDAGIVKVKDLRVEKEHEVARDRLVERVRELLA
jgi:histidyl-tRNA synthetase